MKEYMLIIRGGHEETATQSPEEMQQHMQHWQQWMASLSGSGKLVAGQPLMNEGKSLTDRGKKIIDRPLVEGKELVGGYLIIREESLDQATKLAKNCPGFEYGCTVEVREISALDA